MRRLVASAAAVAVLVAGMGACGGGPSKKKTISDGDAICRRATGGLAAVQKPTSYPQLADAAGSLAKASDDQATGLGRLDLPGGDDKTQLRAIFSALRGVGTAARSLQEGAAKSEDAATAAAAGQTSTSAKDAADRARAYGFLVCGSSTQAPANTVVDGAKGVVKASFVTKAEAACRESDDKTSNVREPNENDLRSVGRYFDALLPVADQMLEKLRALAVPPGDEPTVKELLDAQGALVIKARELTTAAKANNARLFASLADELQVLQTAADAKADAYGIRACGTASET